MLIQAAHVVGFDHFTSHSRATAYQHGRDREGLLMRDLRHQTKNALQRILGMIEEAPELRESARARAFSESLQRRILLSARISDALFGFTSCPGTLESRMRSMAEAVVELLNYEDGDVCIETNFDGDPPECMQQMLLRVAHEYVTNAVKHGLRDRRLGKIVIRLKAQDDWMSLTVADNGSRFEQERFKMGEGMALAAEIAAEYQGRVDLRRVDGNTVATLNILDARRGSS